jgi:hypothetical protein
MAVDERNIIDFVSAGKDGTVTLSIADHLSWDDEQQHLYQLQEKLNRYMDFINSGELAEKFPEAADLRPIIKVHFVHPPTAAAKEVLSKAASLIEAERVSFTFDTLPADKTI